MLLRRLFLFGTSLHRFQNGFDENFRHGHVLSFLKNRRPSGNPFFLQRPSGRPSGVRQAPLGVKNLEVPQPAFRSPRRLDYLIDCKV